jgi:hypothetical protein
MNWLHLRADLSLVLVRAVAESLSTCDTKIPYDTAENNLASFQIQPCEENSKSAEDCV